MTVMRTDSIEYLEKMVAQSRRLYESAARQAERAFDEKRRYVEKLEEAQQREQDNG